jgi:hypothetical protein
MNHLRFLLAFFVVLGSYGLSSGQDEQQPPQQSQLQRPQYGGTHQPHDPATVREWIGLIPNYQKPAGVESQYGVITEVRVSRNLPPAMPEGQTKPTRSMMTPSIPASSGNAYRSPATSSAAIQSPQRNPSKQAVRKIAGLGQTGVKPMAKEKLVSKDAPRSFSEYGAQLLTTLLPKPEPHDLILRCGVQGRSADVVTGRCM